MSTNPDRTFIPLDALEDGRWYARRASVPLDGQEASYVALLEALGEERPLTGQTYNKTHAHVCARGLYPG